MKKSAYELMAQGYEELRLKEKNKDNQQEAGFIKLDKDEDRPLTPIEKMMKGYGDGRYERAGDIELDMKTGDK